MSRSAVTGLAGRRVLITGAARGVGAALARRLYQRGARVALAGLEPELLAEVAAECGDAPWRYCDVADADGTERAVDELAQALDGLDVVVANAGIARGLPLVGGDPSVLEKHLRVNVLGVYHTVRVAGRHVAHARGYALVIASLAAAVQAPLLGAYSASKAAVEALGNTLRVELRHTGARVGVGYFAELDTDMTRRGFDSPAGKMIAEQGWLTGIAPLETGIAALERGIARRSRRIVAPWWVGPLLPARMLVQRAMETRTRRGDLAAALRAAQDVTDMPFTTPQPGDDPPERQG